MIGAQTTGPASAASGSAGLEAASQPARDESVPRRVLAIFAHPDDAEFACGGSIARWADAGADIVYVVCTDGGRGGDGLAADDEAVRALREAEQHEAATRLGVAEVVFLRHPDGDLDAVRSLRHELAGLIRRWRPERVLAWDGWRRYQLHPDHRAAGLAAVDAVLAAGNPRMFPKLAASGLRPHRVQDVYLFGTDHPDVWIDVTATFERKLGAVAAHRSQVASLPGLTESLRRCNQDHGRVCGCAFAEPFKVLRPFCEI